MTKKTLYNCQNFNCSWCGERITGFEEVVLIQNDNQEVFIVHQECLHNYMIDENLKNY